MCGIDQSPHASNINFLPSWRQTAVQIIGLASRPSSSALIFVPQREKPPQPRPKSTNIEKKKKERKEKTKRGQINTLFPTNVTSRNPCWLWWQVAVQPLTHSGALSQIRHAAARGDIGDRQPAQRMKADEQLSAGCAACNPVLTTLVRPPRRLELGRQTLFFFLPGCSTKTRSGVDTHGSCWQFPKQRQHINNNNKQTNNNNNNNNNDRQQLQPLRAGPLSVCSRACCTVDARGGDLQLTNNTHMVFYYGESAATCLCPQTCSELS